MEQIISLKGKRVKASCGPATVMRSILILCHLVTGKASICDESEPGDLPKFFTGHAYVDKLVNK